MHIDRRCRRCRFDTHVLTVIVSGVALVVSLVAAREAIRAHRDTRTTEAVVQTYAIFRDFSDLRMNNWQLSHLFEPPQYYEETCKLLARAVGELTFAQKSELLLKERAIALRIFDVFEQVYFQRDAALRHRDDARKVFLTDVLNYLTNIWLRNPRLAYLWRSELSVSFEPSTVAYYNERVAEHGGDEQPEDAYGPYGSRT